MEQIDITYQTFHDAFKRYLLKKNEGDDHRVAALLNVAEHDLPTFIRENVDNQFTSLYDVHDGDLLLTYQDHITTNAVLKAVDRNMDEISYTTVLTYYRRFLKSREYPDGNVAEPLPVPGENSNDQGDDNFDQSEITPGEKDLHEGAEVQLQHASRYERSREAVEECKAYYRSLHHGHLVCECCGFDFSIAYPGLGDDFIEIHHRHPVSQRGGDYQIDPKKDLVPLCSNCHSMIHRIGGPGDCMSLEDLKKRFKGKHYPMPAE